MLKNRLKNLVRESGFIFTVVLALCCMFFFFGKLLKNPNQVYFGVSDDGLQAYYGAIYHIKHDSSYWHMNGMNYPYGDQVFFTGCQPFITNPIKLVSKVIDISDYTVGILNVIMLFSVFFCALCLYLIFKHLRLPSLYSAIAAVAISFLSPQILRLPAHYSLTYQFAIPLFLLLLLKFQQSPSLKKSFLISSFVFFMAGTHFYFFGFFALISVFYWSILFFSKVSLANLKFTITHIFIQIILPFLLFQLILFLIDDVHDRTNNPWGYLTYISNLAGVFYPMKEMPYQPLFNSFIKPEFPPSGEGYSYIGIVATLTSIFLILVFFKRILFFQFKKLLWITDNKILNIFCWASLFALVLSFGYPFKISGYEHLFQYAGLLKQMRGVARFSWAFYYVINIITFYIIAQWVSHKNPLFKNVVLTIVLFMVSYDAYYLASPMQQMLNNPMPKLADKKNLSPENKWLNEVNLNDYQAIITLPYVHVGSENIWRSDETFDILNEVYIVSIKTGLPTISSMMSRTSLSQTFNNIQLVLEPYRKLEIVSDFKSKKSFLVLVIENQLNEDEKPLLSQCKKIKETPLFNVYELSYSALAHRSDNLYSEAIVAMNKSKTYIIEDFKYTDSVKTFIYNEFNSNTNLNKSNSNYFLGRIPEYNPLFYDTIPNFTQEQEYTVSFWMDNFTEDLYPRTTCVIDCLDPEGNSYNKEEFVVGQRLRLHMLENHKALIESKIHIKNQKDHLRISIFHYEIFDTKKMVKISELLIKPSKDTIYKMDDEQSIMRNNRIYLQK